MTTSLPFPAQLSAAIVAFTIECDNAAESRVRHRTTAHGGSGPKGSVWMTSLAMWFNCLRGLSEAGALTVSQLAARARMPTNLDGMRRWGYVTIDGVGRVKRGEARPRAGSGSVLALTRRGEAAAELWRPLPGEVERRWRERFDASEIERLREALAALARGDGRALPDFLPIGSARGVGIEDPPAGGTGADASDLSLVSLLCRVLLAFALDYERDAKLSLSVQLNGLRVIDPDGVAVRDLPGLTGVSKEASAMIVSQLERLECVVVEPAAGTARGKQVRLSDGRGTKAKAAGERRMRRIADAWEDRHGAGVITALGDVLEPIVGDGSRSGSPLFGGLAPPDGGWRGEVPAPERLPWFPMVLHRGGYPDGS